MAFMVQPIRAELGLTDFQISLLHGLAFAIAYALFALPIGFFVDRTSRRRIIYFGMTVWSSATALVGLTRTFPQLFAARMAVGAGEAALNPAAYSIISDSFPKRRLTFAIVVYVCGAATANALSIMFVGSLITATAEMETIAIPVVGNLKPWRAIFMLVGLAGLLMALLIFTIYEPARRNRISKSTLPLLAVWDFLKGRASFFTCHFMGFSLIHLIAYAISAWLPTYMMRKFGWSARDVGFVYAAEVMVGVPFTLAVGWFVDRRFHRGQTDIHLIVYAMLILLCAVLIVGATTTSHAWVAASLIVLGLPMLSYSGIAAAALQLASPNEFRGQITAMFLFMAIALGQGLGPSVPAALTDFLFQDDQKVGWSMALTIAIVAPIAAGLLCLGRSPMRRAMQEATEWSSD